ncbi:MAG: peptidylprolyl isomerase, partial [Pseudomonadota bacterium]
MLETVTTTMIRRPLVILLLTAATLLATVPGATAQTPFRPVAVVNDSAITGFDIDQRMRILRLLGFPTASVEALQQAALNELIEDRLKLSEGARIGLNPTPDGVAGGYDDVASSIEVATPELRTLLSNQGITEQAMDDFVAANVVWRSLVRSRFAARIEPGEAEIDSEIALSAAVRGVDYRLQEIGLPSDDAGRSAGETLALAERLRREIDSAEAFSQAARQLSRAPSAEVGGELGWVSGEALPPELSEALAELQPGDITRPLQVPGGVSLLRLVERRRLGGDDVDASDPELRERVRRAIVRA